MDLHLTQAGREGRPTIVLLHALSKSAEDWTLVAEDLARDHHVLVPDLRGHGASPWPGTYSFALMRDDVIALLEAHGPVTLVGHSMGGTIAYHVVMHRPDLVQRLVIEDTPPPRPVPMDPPPPEPPGPLPFDWECLVQLSAEFADPDPTLWTGLDSIDVPTLVIAGGPDSTVPQDDLREVAALIPDARLRDLGGGHFVHEARPEQYLATVRDFLARTRI